MNKLPYLKEIKLKGIILDNCWKEYNNFKNITKIESICFNFNNPIKKKKDKKDFKSLIEKMNNLKGITIHNGYDRTTYFFVVIVIQ